MNSVGAKNLTREPSALNSVGAKNLNLGTNGGGINKENVPVSGSINNIPNREKTDKVPREQDFSQIDQMSAMQSRLYQLQSEMMAKQHALLSEQHKIVHNQQIERMKELHDIQTVQQDYQFQHLQRMSHMMELSLKQSQSLSGQFKSADTALVNPLNAPQVDAKAEVPSPTLENPLQDKRDDKKPPQEISESIEKTQSKNQEELKSLSKDIADKVLKNLIPLQDELKELKKDIQSIKTTVVQKNDIPEMMGYSPLDTILKIEAPTQQWKRYDYNGIKVKINQIKLKQSDFDLPDLISQEFLPPTDELEDPVRIKRLVRDEIQNSASVLYYSLPQSNRLNRSISQNTPLDEIKREPVWKSTPKPESVRAPSPTKPTKLTSKTKTIKPPVKEKPPSRPPSRVKSTKTASSNLFPSDSLPSSPKKSPKRPLNFYNVKLSNAPVFLRRTSIRPPTLNFLDHTIKKLDHVIHPPSPTRSKTSSPVKQMVDIPAQRSPEPMWSSTHLRRPNVSEAIQTLPERADRATQKTPSPEIDTLSDTQTIQQAFSKKQDVQDIPIEQTQPIKSQYIPDIYENQKESNSMEQEPTTEWIHATSYAPSRPSRPLFDKKQQDQIPDASKKKNLERRIAEWVQNEVLLRVLARPGKVQESIGVETDLMQPVEVHKNHSDVAQTVTELAEKVEQVISTEIQTELIPQPVETHDIALSPIKFPLQLQHMETMTDVTAQVTEPLNTGIQTDEPIGDQTIGVQTLEVEHKDIGLDIIPERQEMATQHNYTRENVYQMMQDIEDVADDMIQFTLNVLVYTVGCEVLADMKSESMYIETESVQEASEILPMSPPDLSPEKDTHSVKSLQSHHSESLFILI